jgi:transcriptional regulator with XRE-family HTH domain
MRESKKKSLEKQGWRVGSTDDFLNLSAEESEYIELKLKLSQALKNKRQQKGLTQVEAARALRSSQSRIAKMETGDPSVSIDLLIRALLTMGATPKELGRVVGSWWGLFVSRKLAPELAPKDRRKQGNWGETGWSLGVLNRSRHSTYFGLSSSSLLLPKPEVGGSTPPGAIASKPVSAVGFRRSASIGISAFCPELVQLAPELAPTRLRSEKLCDENHGSRPLLGKR